jgi:hypothetical protein
MLETLGRKERWLLSLFPSSKGNRRNGEIRQCWYDEIAVLAAFLLHLEPLLMPLGMASKNYNLPSASKSCIPKT